MALALTGLACFFLPGMIGYGVVCLLIPARNLLTHLVRGLLIAVLTGGLGIVGGYVFVYVRDSGPYDDGWHINMAFTFGVLQLVIGFLLGIVSLTPLSSWVKRDYEVIELVKLRK